MSAGQRPAGPYEADPTPYLGLLAIAGGLFISAPALVGGSALARVARRATATFAGLAGAGAVWTWLWWARIGLEMHRAERAGRRHRMFMHPETSLDAAWPHIRTWWLLAAPLCFAVALA